MIANMDAPHSSLHTRPSLLFRLRDWEDKASWEEFYRLYRNFVYGLAKRGGLTHVEAEEVTQEVFVRVAETIQDFESDPARGTFRGWLAQLTRWRIADKFRARPRDAAGAGSRRSQEIPDATRTIERLADDRTAPLDAASETEWQKHVLDAALGRLARRAPAKHFQVFDLYSRQGWPVMRVARELGINPASVYLISHRLTKQLKAEVETLRSSLG
jgi:RNA polymerase sigma-70 factor (ECF subfamily)